MKRDFSLIKSILLEIEKNPKASEWMDIKINGYSNEQVAYHIKLLHDSGLIEAKDLTTKDGFRWIATSMTWEGHA